MIVKRLYWFIHRWILRRSHVIIALSKTQKDLLVAAEPSIQSRVYVVPNGVNLDKFNPQKIDPAIFREKYSLSGYIVLLFVGRLVHEKGVITLLQSLSWLRDSGLISGFKIKLLIVGSGPDEVSMRAFVENKRLSDLVLFLGTISDDELLHAYAAADICVFPYAWEGLPYTVLEAMAMAKAVVASATGAIPEVISDRETGILIPLPLDSRSLAEILLMLIKSPELRAKLGQRARNFITDHYDLANSLVYLNRIYDMIAKRLK
jgi:glycosyltransferase involved in cell wall biosynthesis